MIRVRRGDEPAEVVAQRAVRLPAAVAAALAHGVESEALGELLRDYDAGKRALFVRQHRKCAFCERKPGLTNQPLEHFRPKKGAARHRKGEPRSVDRRRYWWLAWSWENHFFACVTCNGAGTKGSFFPLEPGSAPLPEPDLTSGVIAGDDPCWDTTAERPLLLDPSDPSVDPLDHLQWSPVDQTLHPGSWHWALVTPTPQGERTAEIFELRALSDDVDDHYRDKIWPRVMGLARELDPVLAWELLGRELTRPEASFAAASWWMLESLRTRAPGFRALGLPALRRPGVVTAPGAGAP